MYHAKNQKKFNFYLKSDKPLSIIPKSNNTGGYKLSIVGEHLQKRLIELGVFPRKSLILKFPTSDQVPEHLIRHFLRGYWDGDGSFSVWKTSNGWNRATTNIVSSIEFCESVKSLIKEQLKINASITGIENPFSRRLVVSNISRVFPIIDWLYKDSNVSLIRKYQKYLSFKETILKIDRFKYLCE